MTEQTRTIQRRLRDELPSLKQRYAVASLQLFGSRLRGDERPDSDLDVLATFSKTPGLFRLIELQDYLTDLVGVKVDLVFRDSLKADIRERVLNEAVPV